MSQSLSIDQSTDQSFHVAFCVDGHYLRAMAATIASIIEHNPEQAFTFHVLSFFMQDEEQQKLKQFECNPLVKTSVHLVDPDDFADLSHLFGSSHYSSAIFSRLLIPTILEESADRVLYLDADILCVGSLRPLIELQDRGEIATVVPDAPITVQRRFEALGLPNQRYFNSGVMLINIKRWLQSKITEKTLEVLSSDRKDMRFPDQDALNLVLHETVRYVSPRFNYLYDLIHDLNLNRTAIRPWGEAVLVHFAGAVKPWCDWSGHDIRSLFRHYLDHSPWALSSLDLHPLNTKEMRMYSRFLFRKGEWMESFGWYLKYLKVKLRKKLS